MLMSSYHYLTILLAVSHRIHVRHRLTLYFSAHRLLVSSDLVERGPLARSGGSSLDNLGAWSLCENQLPEAVPLFGSWVKEKLTRGEADC